MDMRWDGREDPTWMRRTAHPADLDDQPAPWTWGGIVAAVVMIAVAAGVVIATMLGAG